MEIVLQELQKNFPISKKLFNKMNLRIGVGEFVSILGPSGCGKSTLLRLLLGLENPTTGQLRNGFSHAGMVFQDARLLPWLTILENLELPLKIKNLKSSRENLEAKLDQVHLQPATGRSYPHEISGGMKMRAALARALVVQPDILFLDEPLSALDERTRFDLQQDLRELFEKEVIKTVVFVTHSIQEAVFLSSRILMLDQDGSLKKDIENKSPERRSSDWRYSPPAIQKIKEISEGMR